MRILIAAPPKAGNMWLKCLLGTIYGLDWLRGDATPERAELDLFRAWAAGGGFRDGTIFHQHYDYSDELADAVDAIPAHLVTIVRDPYDAFVSSYFTMQLHDAENNRKGRKLVPLMGRAIDDPEVVAFLAEGGYRNNLIKANQWLHSGRATILRYEELQADPLAKLARATDAISPVQRERLEQAIEACRADNMRQRSRGMAKHVRTATVGDWRNHLNDAHLAVFREQYADLIRDLGYEVR